MTLLDFFFKGGPLMYVLLLLSIAGVALVISKYRQLYKVNRAHKNMTNIIGKNSGVNEIHAALGINKEECPLSAVLIKAKSLEGQDLNLIKESTEATANLTVHNLEKGLGWISTISAIAPLVGFLGTVTGMVRVFINIAAHSQQGIDISMLASGIWEALLTTVGGLVVGIPAIFFYNDLVEHVEDIAKFLQAQIDEYVIKLHKSRLEA
ncbi:MAG: MotA/TolQ/ExbB proton channel family protein [Candidatus Cloacimonadaceae bacterium]